MAIGGYKQDERLKSAQQAYGNQNAQAAAAYNQQQNNQNQQGNQGYNGMAGVSSNTGMNLSKSQQGYQQGDAATQAQNYLQQIQAQKPQNYASKYGEQLDNLLNQIQNPQEFKYEFNGDNLFKYYADLYTQKGKQASMDAQGQAAALTGGYGNSYGQMAGQQGYQQYLLNLYDKGMDLRNMAYQQHQDNLGNLKDAYSLMGQAEDRNYGMYRDTVGDWQNERDYAAGRYDTERDFDYGKYRDDLNYWTGLAEIENKAYNTEADRQEAIRQFNQEFAEKQRQYNTTLAEQQRQSALDEAYRRDTLAEQMRQYDTDDAYRARQLEEQIRQYDTTLAEQMRQYDTDDAYRSRQLEEEQRQFDEGMALSRDQLAESMRSTDLDESFRRDQMAEESRQFDEKMTQSDKQFEETTKIEWAELEQQQREHDQTMSAQEKARQQEIAIGYVTSILAKGQMPSTELLIAAGLSQEDAKKLMEEVKKGGSPTGGKDSDKDKGDEGSAYYYDPQTGGYYKYVTTDSGPTRVTVKAEDIKDSDLVLDEVEAARKRRKGK